MALRERSPVAFVGKAPGVAGAHSDSGLAGDVTGNAPVADHFGEICVCSEGFTEVFGWLLLALA